MARPARAVIPGHPHHVTRRGNGRAITFFTNGEHALYRDLLAEHAAAVSVEISAWVLVPNHGHLILVPTDPDGLRGALAAVHRRYAGQIHARLRRTGHFWQGRFCFTRQARPAAAGKLMHCHRNSCRRGHIDPTFAGVTAG